jgi:uncharacterized protein with von Willebrand factor type A (vWA) domain
VIDKLREFGAILRKNGVRVSTAEMLDAGRALAAVGVGDAATMRDALAATLCKQPRDRSTFDELFDLYFLRRATRPREDAALVAALSRRGFDAEQIEAILALLTADAAQLSALGRMGLGLSSGQLARMLALDASQADYTGLANPLQIGLFTARALDRMGFAQAEAELGALARRLPASLGPDAARRAAEALAEVLAGLRGAVRDQVAAEFERRNADFYRRWRTDSLLDRPLSGMTYAELDSLVHEVRRLATKLRDKHVLRRARRRRGRLDVRATLRHSLATGGVPFRLRWRRRRPDKPRIVILCDISDSVRNVSRFALQLTYTLGDLFARVRSFVFVADLGEATGLFGQHALARAIELAYGGAVVSVYANSNYGRALKMFESRYGDAVTPKTTVIVIGDGRNNYLPSEHEVLSRIRRRARRLLWFNPEPPGNWAFGDSAMREYAPHCDRVEVVFSLRTLERAIDAMGSF